MQSEIIGHFSADDGPVKIYDAWTSIQGQLLVDWLRNAGIAARLASTAMEPMMGKVPFHLATCPVWVAKCDEQRALAELQEFEDRLSARSSNETFCYHCGSAVAARQSPCPECGGELDWS